MVRTVWAAAVLLFACGFPAELKAQEFQVGHGVFRPFNVYRQFKLGSAYFVDPSLPERAMVLDAYRLNDVAGERDIPEEILAEVDSGTLRVGVLVPDENSFVLTIPCRPSIEGGEASGHWQCSGSEGSQSIYRLSDRLRNIEVPARADLYVLSPREEHLWTYQQLPFLPETGTPVITWEPQEHVDLGVSDSSLQLIAPPVVDTQTEE